MIIILGLFDKYINNNRFIYKLVIYPTLLISVIYAIEGLGANLGFISKALNFIPLYEQGFGWFVIAIVMFGLSYILNYFIKANKELKEV